MPQSTIKHINFADSALYYKIEGEGMPVVFIHGFAEDSRVWENQVAFFGKKFQVIIPDLPGSGLSPILKKENASIEDYANCIKTILDKEKIESCVIIGHSMGGYICLAFASMYPQMLKSIGLFHSSAFADNEEKKATRKKAIEFIKKNGSDAFLATAIPGLFFDAEKNNNHISSQLEKGTNFTNESLIQYYEAMISRPDTTDTLKNTRLPVLFILGEHDKAIPFRAGLEQSVLPQFTYLSVLRNSAHMGMLEETEKANKILADFLHDQEVK